MKILINLGRTNRCKFLFMLMSNQNFERTIDVNNSYVPLVLFSLFFFSGKDYSTVKGF